MAVGYHKLNGSGARGKRTARKEREIKDLVSSGTPLWDATYGQGVTSAPFDPDIKFVQVPCAFDSGHVVKMGVGAVLVNMENYLDRIEAK